MNTSLGTSGGSAARTGAWASALAAGTRAATNLPRGWADFTGDPRFTGGRAGGRGGGRPRAAVGAAAEEKTEQPQRARAHDPVVGDQAPRDRAEPARVAHQPREDVAARVREQAPRLHGDAEQSGDQPAGLEAD